MEGRSMGLITPKELLEDLGDPNEEEEEEEEEVLEAGERDLEEEEGEDIDKEDG